MSTGLITSSSSSAASPSSPPAPRRSSAAPRASPCWPASRRWWSASRWSPTAPHAGTGRVHRRRARGIRTSPSAMSSGRTCFDVCLILGVAGLVAPLLVARQAVRLEVPIVDRRLPAGVGHRGGRRIGKVDGALLTARIVGLLGLVHWRSRRARPRAARRPASAAARRVGVAPGGRGRDRPGGGQAPLPRARGPLVRRRAVAAGPDAQRLRRRHRPHRRGGRHLHAGGGHLPIVATLRGELGHRHRRRRRLEHLQPSRHRHLVAGDAGGLSVAPSLLAFDLPVIVAVAVACLPSSSPAGPSRGSRRPSSSASTPLTTYLVLKAQEHDTLPAFSAVMLEFVWSPRRPRRRRVGGAPLRRSPRRHLRRPGTSIEGRRDPFEGEGLRGAGPLAPRASVEPARTPSGVASPGQRSMVGMGIVPPVLARPPRRPRRPSRVRRGAGSIG